MEFIENNFSICLTDIPIICSGPFKTMSLPMPITITDTEFPAFGSSSVCKLFLHNILNTIPQEKKITPAQCVG